MIANKIPIIVHPATSMQDNEYKEQRLINKLIKRFIKQQKRFFYEKKLIASIG